jgi:hypothetical protein
MDRLLEMSAKELNRLEVMQRLSKKQMSQKEAGRILDVGVRQIKRLLRVIEKRVQRAWCPGIVGGKGITVCRKK